MLHNICEVHGDSFDDEWLNGVECEDLGTSISSAQTTETAADIHNACHILATKQYYCYTFIVVCYSADVIKCGKMYS